MIRKPFKSDGCSMWFDGIWVDCCKDHDKEYWAGGTKKQRRKSDLKLIKCVVNKSRSFTTFLLLCFVAAMMYIGVRIGGVPWLPTPFRWGFGYDYKKGYRGYRKVGDISVDDKVMTVELFENFEWVKQPFENIEPYTIFRMRDPNTKSLFVGDCGNVVFTAVGYPYVGKYGVLTVDVETEG